MKFVMKVFIVFSLMTTYSFSKETLDITVKGMVCSFCAQGIEKQINALGGIEDIKVDLENYKVMVTSSKSLNEEAVKKAISDAGYNVEAISRLVHEEEDEKLAK